MADPDAPVVFVMGRMTDHADLDAFAPYVMSGVSKIAGPRFTFTINGAMGDPPELRLFLDSTAVPRINGQPFDFMPKRVFDSPHFWSEIPEDAPRHFEIIGKLVEMGDFTVDIAWNDRKPTVATIHPGPRASARVTVACAGKSIELATPPAEPGEVPADLFHL